MSEAYDFETLPDILAPGLSLVLIGINPSTYSVAVGHYFARPTNRFWAAFSRSRISAAARAGLGVEALRPEHDQQMPRFGIGFTDVVKRPSPMATALRPEDYRLWTPRLVERLRAVQADVACFHGLTAFRPFLRWGLGLPFRDCALGPQAVTLGRTRVFVVPNPSPANAHFTPADQAAWYDRLEEFIRRRPSSDKE